MSPTPPPPSMGAQIGVGNLWQPTPASFAWIRGDGPAGPFYILRLELVTGVVAVPFDENSVQELIAKAQEVTSGLVIPRAPMPGSNGGVG